MTIVVDTNFLISATQWNYSVSHKLLLNLIEKKITILDEFMEFLERDFGYIKEESIQIVDALLPFLTIIEPKMRVSIINSDPDDDKVLECALESKSRYIITYDKHLLNLKGYQGIRIIRPEEARVIF